MSTDIVQARSSELSIGPSQTAFTDSQVSVLRQLGVTSASVDDLRIFFHRCQSTGLDPFSGQIYMIGRRSREGQNWVVKQTIQTGIDGYRLIAHRAAEARGMSLSCDDTLWADGDGHWHDLWIWDAPPTAAKVVVRVGEARFSGVATTTEYMPMRMDRSGREVPMGLWAKMPATMVAKCAEALALRKAFPLDLSGIYTTEEMMQADARERTIATETASSQPRPRLDYSRVTRAMTDCGVTQAEMLEVAKDIVGRTVTSANELTQDELDAVADAVIAGAGDSHDDTVDAELVDPDTGEVTQ